MPTREEILSGLTWIANEYTGIAIVWHLLILLLIAALFARWKPGNNLMILMLSSLLMSVSGFAFLQGNYFNAAVFAFLLIVSILVSLRSGRKAIRGDRSWTGIIGLLLIAFGLLYPEFVNTDSQLDYLYSAPTGLIPCPTLSILIGFALLYRGCSSPIWTMTLGISGLFYGLVGVFYLHMNIDWFLVAASAFLLLNKLIFLKKSMSLSGHH